METSTRTSVMNDNDVLVHPDEEITYRSVSVLSIVGLVVGLAAPLSLVAPLLWVVPIVGAAISLAAILRIASSDGALVGRGAALVGLVLCVVSISAAASRSGFAKYFVSRQAREVVLEWVAALQAGHSQQAFELTVEGARQSSTPASETQVQGDEQGNQRGGEPEPDDAPAGSPLEKFLENPVVHFLMTDGANAQASFDRDLAVEFGARGEVHIQQQFTLRWTGSDETTPPVNVQIILTRSGSLASAASRWLVSDFQSDDLPVP